MCRGDVPEFNLHDCTCVRVGVLCGGGGAV